VLIIFTSTMHAYFNLWGVLALDIDECKIPSEMDADCFGECINVIGSYQCSCPPGTIGNPRVKGGCVHYNFTRGQCTSLTFLDPSHTFMNFLKLLRIYLVFITDVFYVNLIVI
jgi:hypothetical protein